MQEPFAALQQKVVTDPLLPVFHSELFQVALPVGHRFPSAKYGKLRQRIQAELASIEIREAPEATRGELALVHEPAYVEAVMAGTLDSRALRDIGFPWSEALAQRSCRSTGATVAAMREVLGLAPATGRAEPAGTERELGRGRVPIAGNLGGGTHHARADGGSGYCVFNDVAVAARVAQMEHARRLRRTGGRPLPVAVIDLDVHQGNGTAQIFHGDDSVFTLSIHGEKNFPFRKHAGDLDVDLPDGCGDDAYLHALDFALAELAQRFTPELVFFIAGADVHERDRLGRLKLSRSGVQARDRRVFDWAIERALPMVVVMGGGYGADIDETVDIQMGTWRTVLEAARRWQNRRT